MLTKMRQGRQNSKIQFEKKGKMVWRYNTNSAKFGVNSLHGFLRKRASRSDDGQKTPDAGCSCYGISSADTVRVQNWKFWETKQMVWRYGGWLLPTKVGGAFRENAFWRTTTNACTMKLALLTLSSRVENVVHWMYNLYGRNKSRTATATFELVAEWTIIFQIY